MVRFVVLLAIVPLVVSCESDPQPSERSELEQATYELQQLQNGVELPAVHFRSTIER